jgi:hypothetical protein
MAIACNSVAEQFVVGMDIGSSTTANYSLTEPVEGTRFGFVKPERPKDSTRMQQSCFAKLGFDSGMGWYTVYWASHCSILPVVLEAKLSD